jgi:predicted TIM-barrel fold metal-dependent hydrolase
MIQKWIQRNLLKFQDKNVIYFDTVDDDNSANNLKKALSLLPYDKPYRILPFRMSLRPIILEVIEKYNLRIINEKMGNLCYLPKEIAVGIETEEIPGMTYSRLGKHHAKLIDDLWGGKCDGSRQYLERLIDYNPSLGLIDENDKLVAWILRYPLQYFPELLSLIPIPSKDENMAQLVCSTSWKSIERKATDTRYPKNS